MMKNKLTLTQLRTNLICTYEECIKYPFRAYDHQDFDYFYHLVEQAEQVITGVQSDYIEIDFDVNVFKEWFKNFKNNNNF